MSASPGHPSLRARIVEVLALVLDANAHRAVGRDLGIAGTTVTARGCDLHAWPADDLLRLAVTYPDLNDAIETFLVGTSDAPAESHAVERDLSAIIGRAALLIVKANDSLADGQVDVLECAENRERLAEVLALIPKAIANIDRRVSEARARSGR